jgi:2'-5' RNA ligase
MIEYDKINHMHRVFIAINLPEEIKKELVNYQANWPQLPIRWTKKNNLHITLIFLGSLSEQEVIEVCKTTREITQQYNSFKIRLNKIAYGPPRKIPPRMIWVEGACPEIVEGKKIDKLSYFKNDLEGSLLERVNFSPEKRPFSPHITLGRIRGWEWRRIEPEDRPKVESEISLEFEVNSIDVMESHLKKEGAEYAVLESAPLKL